jgi:hypothetical protein
MRRSTVLSLSLQLVFPGNMSFSLRVGLNFFLLLTSLCPNFCETDGLQLDGVVRLGAALGGTEERLRGIHCRQPEGWNPGVVVESLKEFFNFSK